MYVPPLTMSEVLNTRSQNCPSLVVLDSTVAKVVIILLSKLTPVRPPEALT